jgi:hypothetical protein
MTDYRLSVAKVIPIEAHEVIDHAWGLAAIAAPFVLGYWKPRRASRSSTSSPAWATSPPRAVTCSRITSDRAQLRAMPVSVSSSVCSASGAFDESVDITA